MINSQMFQQMSQYLNSMFMHTRSKVSPTELFIRELVANQLEIKLRQSIGPFGPTASPNRVRREDKITLLEMRDFRVISPESGCQMACTVNQPTETWLCAEWDLPSDGIRIRVDNVGYIQPENNSTGSSEGRAEGLNGNRSVRTSFRDDDFDKDAFAMFRQLLGQTVTEVLVLAIPPTASTAVNKLTPGQLVYKLGCRDKIEAAGVVMAVDFRTALESGQIADTQMYSPLTGKAEPATSAHYGSELDWAKSISPRKEGRGNNDFPVTDVTDSERTYLTNVIERIQAIMSA